MTLALAPLAVPVSLRKGEFLQRSGTPAQWMYWIFRGVTRNGFITESGAEVTLRFTMDGEAAGSHEDLLQARAGIAAQHFVIAETAVEGHRMDWQEVMRVTQEQAIVRDYYLKAAEASIVRQSRRIGLGSHSSAQDRLAEFRREYPGLERRISQKVIASFLGITPQYLSQMLRGAD
ncbi:Crp/Fnr family transcriptional regulator [Oxalobacteraceae bacterium]|nr:Crp/Fnr family transcriptional regulator [Oxalobacteraceae bacterium]